MKTNLVIDLIEELKALRVRESEIIEQLEQIAKEGYEQQDELTDVPFTLKSGVRVRIINKVRKPYIWIGKWDSATVEKYRRAPNTTTGSPQGGGNLAGGQRNNGRRGNRNNNSGRFIQGRGATNAITTINNKFAFKGDIAEMNGHVFECIGERATRPQFTKTLEALRDYVKVNMTPYSEDLNPLFDVTMSAPSITAPTRPADDAVPLVIFDYQEDKKEYNKRARALIGNQAALFAVIWGQCSEALRSKLKALDEYTASQKENNCFWLLTQIRSIVLNFDKTKEIIVSLREAKLSYLTCTQKPHETVEVYMENIRAWVEAIEAYGGTIVEHKKPKDDLREESVWYAEARDKSMAIALIQGADPNRFGSLKNELQSSYGQGVNRYPTTFTGAYNFLLTYCGPPTRANSHNNNTNTGTRAPVPGGATTVNAAPGNNQVSAMTFAQIESPVAGDDGATFPNILCFKCRKQGHLPTIAHRMRNRTLTPQRNNVLRAITNGGYQDSHFVGEFPNLGTVWYNPDSIANILSLAEVRRVCQVTMNIGPTDTEASITVHRMDGTPMKFVESPNGLYIYAPNDNESVNVYCDVSLIQTVDGQKKLFTKREVDAADAARALYRKIGRPSEAEFQNILQSNFIRNCPVTPDDAKRALLIYGPDVATLKGTTRRSAPAAHVPSFEAVPIPAPLLEHHRNITLCADFFYVQQLPFFHSISRKVNFRTIASVSDRTKRTILKEARTIINLYQARGFVVSDIHADHEFACIRHDIRPVNLDIVPADSHVGEVERSVQTIKNRLRSAVHGLPYRRLPKLMIIELVNHVVRSLNQFPSKNGVSDTMSPTTIVTGQGLPDFNKMSIEFGTYAQIFEDNDPSNTLHSRTLGAIALGPTGNANGDYVFLSLATGRRVTRRSWTSLPVPDTAIARVEALALLDGMPLIQEDGLVVEWRPDFPIPDDEYDLDYHPPRTTPADTLADFFLPVTPNELHDLGRPLDELPVNSVQGADPNDDLHNTDDIDDSNNQGASDNNPPENRDNEEHQDVEYEGAIDEEEGAMRNNDGIEPELANEGTEEEQVLPTEEATTTHTYNLRPRQLSDNRQTFQTAVDEPHSQQSYFPPMQNLIVAHVMTQMTERAGLRKHGEAAEAALLREFQQLEDLSVFEPRFAHELSNEERKGALRALNLLKEKRDGSLKGRTVADGSKQRHLYDRSQTASPTVSNDALMATIIVDAMEKRDVATCDVAGAYLNAPMDDIVILRFTDKAVELMCKMDKKYEPYVVVEKEKSVLYVQLKKALYGCVQSALLWYRLFADTLQAMGFELNPYEQCVANCYFGEKQCTIAWYVDDMKVSHVDPEVVSAVIKNIESSFGKMTVTRGTEHEFLGMQITYNENGTATLSMRRYLEEAIAESNLAITKCAATPAKRFLFDVNESSKILNAERGEFFHRVAAKLLYVATRARMDILLAVCFLCTRVSKATEEDESKLKRVLEYLKGTLDLVYTIGGDDIGKLRTWVDASYAVHPDMKSHTGGLVSFGTGGMMCRSSKQKLNTKSSTEAELVGASDYVPNTIWLKNFMDRQGYPIREAILEQDNESAIKLETNGRGSAGSKSRHINIRYFFLKDRVTSGEFSIRHCPTEQMVADFFTKPLQGELFRKFRGMIMGEQHMSTLIGPTGQAGSEERVGSIQSDPVPVSTIKNLENDVLQKEGKVSKKVTWADVVKGDRFERTFSRNNPVALVKLN